LLSRLSLYDALPIYCRVSLRDCPDQQDLHDCVGLARRCPALVYYDLGPAVVVPVEHRGNRREWLNCHAMDVFCSAYMAAASCACRWARFNSAHSSIIRSRAPSSRNSKPCRPAAFITSSSGGNIISHGYGLTSFAYLNSSDTVVTVLRVRLFIFEFFEYFLHRGLRGDRFNFWGVENKGNAAGVW